MGDEHEVDLVTGADRPDGVPVLIVGAGPVSPTATACVSQDVPEPILLNHLRTLPSARIGFGVKLAGVDRPDGVRAVLGDVRTGESRMVDAGYLIAADGAGFDGTRGDLYDRYWLTQ